MAISVLIGTYNSAKYLRKVLEYVKGYDEVLVYDMGSTDESVEIAREAGCRVIHTGIDAEDSSHTHNDAIRSAKNDWILLLRPYELAPRDLKDYLYDFIEHSADVHGLFIPRRKFIMDKEDYNSYPDFHLRFFQRDGTVWNEGKNELPSVCGNTKRIPAHRKNLAIIHIPRSVNEMIGNLEENYGNHAEPKRVSLIKIISATVGTFLREFVVKGKFKHGTIGYIDSVNASMKDYFILAKGHEMSVMNEINKKLQ